MDEIKNAFRKVKEDFDDLNKKFIEMKDEIFQTREGLIEVINSICFLNNKFNSFKDKEIKTEEEQFKSVFTENKTNPLHFKLRNAQNLGISIGNEGVQTDRQTDRQTNKRLFSEGEIPSWKDQNSFEEFSGLLESLDGLKKEIRLKFKRLTNQEMVIFSAIYQMEEEKGFSDYKSLSNKLSLTESSIRDYVRRLIFKGIPLEKKKINNKEIRLFVSKSLKKIASLNTILKLIEL